MSSCDEPVVRCGECCKLMFTVHFDEGGCIRCGGHIAAALQEFSAREFSIMEERGVDPEFFQLFEPASVSRDNELFVRSRKNGEEARCKEKGNYGAAEMAR